MSQQELSSSTPTRRRGAYSLAAGAAASLVAADASAVVVHSGPQNISVVPGTPVPINFDGNAFQDVSFSNISNFLGSGNSYQGGSVLSYPGKFVSFSSGITYVTALGNGALIDSSSSFAGFAASLAFGSSNPNAQFNTANGAFVGLTFPGGPNNYFGWVRVDIDNAAGSFVIRDWAYEDQPGVGITTPAAIPEPSSLAFLAAGAAGVGLMRRLRRSSK